MASSGLSKICRSQALGHGRTWLFWVQLMFSTPENPANKIKTTRTLFIETSFSGHSLIQILYIIISNNSKFNNFQPLNQGNLNNTYTCGVGFEQINGCRRSSRRYSFTRLFIPDRRSFQDKINNRLRVAQAVGMMPDPGFMNDLDSSTSGNFQTDWYFHREGHPHLHLRLHATGVFRFSQFAQPYPSDFP